jgi:hypothetical protein
MDDHVIVVVAAARSARAVVDEIGDTAAVGVEALKLSFTVALAVERCNPATNNRLAKTTTKARLRTRM